MTTETLLKVKENGKHFFTDLINTTMKMMCVIKMLYQTFATSVAEI